MKRINPLALFLGISLLLFPIHVRAYLLSPNFVLERMVRNYRSVQGITVTQRIDAFGEDTVIPFASLDERVEMFPFVSMKIWVRGKVISSGEKLPPELGASRFLIKEQRRFGFYKDVFLIHEVNLLKALLERLSVPSFHSRLSLMYPNIAYQIGASPEGEPPVGIWIDKQRFIPLKLVGRPANQPGSTTSNEKVKILYSDYRLLKNKIWFPFEIKFYVNGNLSLRIKVFSVTLTEY